MAKRQTATEKWLDPWFCNLSIVDRLFWIYLCDNCDHAGIWQVNMLLVQTYFPGYTPKTETFGDRLQVLTPEKWYLTKFVQFQYGALNPENRVHRSVLERLRKEGASKALVSPFQGAKDKDKEQDKDSVGVKKGSLRGNRFVPPTLEELKAYAQVISYRANVEKFLDYYTAKGWLVGKTPMKDWKASLRMWKSKDEETHGTNDRKSFFDLKAHVRAAREAKELRKVASPREILDRIRSVQNVSAETGTDNRGPDDRS